MFSLGFPHSSAGKESACNARDPSLIPESGRSPGEGMAYPLQYSWAPLVAQTVKNPSTMWDTWVGKIPRRRAWRPTPVFLPEEFSWTEEPGGLQSVGSPLDMTKHSMLPLRFGKSFYYEWTLNFIKCFFYIYCDDRVVLLLMWCIMLIAYVEPSLWPCAGLSHSVMSDSFRTHGVACQAPLSMGILQARILEWLAIPSSRGSSQTSDRIRVSCTAMDSLLSEPSGKPKNTGLWPGMNPIWL